MKTGHRTRALVSRLPVLHAWCLQVATATIAGLGAAIATVAFANHDPVQPWIGTWSAAPQRAPNGREQTYGNQTLRLIVHTSIGGANIRIRFSNVFGRQPLVIGGAHVARRTAGAAIDPGTDRALTFGGSASTTIPVGSFALSDAADLKAPPLSDLAISVFLPSPTVASTVHILAKQTNFVCTEAGDSTAAVTFPNARTITSWPFLTGVDVVASPHGAAIVALGSSLTDGDGSTRDANRRWPDVLAERLQEDGDTELGVLNEGIIGNRLLSDSESPHQAGGPAPLGPVYGQLGPTLGEAGVARFDRDVLAQSAVRYVILALGVNDILFPGAFIPDSEAVTSSDLIAGYRQLIARAHKAGMRLIGTTIPPCEHALFRDPFFNGFYTARKERVREEVNDWVRHSGEFDGVIDFDAVVRDPDHPTQILPAYDSGDHLHVNDAGNVAQANAIPLGLFHRR